jgi:hypothetical protein
MAPKKKTAAKKAVPAEKKEQPKDELDQYYPVKTGDTFESIAKSLGKDGKAQELFDSSHKGGVANNEIVARHINLISGANGDAKDERGRRIPVLTGEDVSLTTPLTEGLSLLLPKGW